MSRTVLLTFGEIGTAIPLESFYPFGVDSNDSFLPPNDDGSSERIFLNRPFPFFGSRHTSLFVSVVCHCTVHCYIANL